MSNRTKLVIAPLALSLVAFLPGCKQSQPAPEATTQPAQPSVPQIGGQPVVKITRPATSNAQGMEFLSATILPGRGMNLFQITANVPGKGEIPILASPTLEEAAQALNGGPADDNGNASFSFGGAFLVPYPNRIVGPLSPDGKTVTTKWHGKTITLPAN
ncbi:MAG TPA: hypothetical protein VHE33_01685, partial [Acidobacteriaceae bacterium]|nr:hypothetical protein [Acidobacteriaceae bacterium]